MATTKANADNACKAFTSPEQSKKLAKILPIETADMFLAMNGTLPVMSKYIDEGFVTADDTAIPCWSAAALLEVIRNNGRYELKIYEGGYYFKANGFMTESHFNLTDAAYEMIIRLDEEKML
jgi:hypothetical protein